jgi:hypothetical protein
MHPTAVAGQGGEPTALLYDASRRQAGENLQGRWDKRQAGLAKPCALADALASQAVAKEAAVIRGHWLAPGRRPCRARTAGFPQACQGVREGIRQVVDQDEQGRQEQLSAEARWASPQGPSQPLLAARQRGRDPQRDAHLGEPNRSLGRAIGSRRTPWATLPRFCTTPGAPSANHVAARVWKRCIRQRTNALV